MAWADRACRANPEWVRGPASTLSDRVRCTDFGDLERLPNYPLAFVYGITITCPDRLPIRVARHIPAQVERLMTRQGVASIAPRRVRAACLHLSGPWQCSMPQSTLCSDTQAPILVASHRPRTTNGPKSLYGRTISVSQAQVFLR